VRTTFIYGLYSTNDSVIRYVGKSNNPKDRLRMHIYESKYTKTKTHKCDWIRHEILLNNDIEYKILEECDMSVWSDREIYWMTQFNDLTNTSKVVKVGHH
jgi:hypothetical protein